MNNYFVYILTNSTSNKTYVGMTNDLAHRIRQHNGIIKGGAKYTTNFLNNGVWHYYTIIENLDKRNALSIEKKIKIYSRKMKGTPIEKRLKAVNKIIIFENNTNQKL